MWQRRALVYIGSQTLHFREMKIKELGEMNGIFWRSLSLKEGEVILVFGFVWSMNMIWTQFGQVNKFSVEKWSLKHGNINISFSEYVIQGNHMHFASTLLVLLIHKAHQIFQFSYTEIISLWKSTLWVVELYIFLKKIFIVTYSHPVNIIS